MRPDHPRQADALRRFLAILLVLALAHWAFREGSSARGTVHPYRISLNRAGSTELTLIPGVGPTLASRIVVSRHTLGHAENFVVVALCHIELCTKIRAPLPAPS